MSARSLWDMDLRERCMDLPRMRQVLSSLDALPGELPFLTDIAALCAGTPGVEPDTAASWGPVRRGLNRRYLRIRFVQDELERMDFKKAKPGVRFRDFIFDQIDFSAYKKISQEEYSLYSQEGLEDFDTSFFMRNFRLSREKAGELIHGAYIQIGGFYYIRQEKMLSNPWLMSILRTLQTSLEFAPLFSPEAIRNEYRSLSCSMPCLGEGESGDFLPEQGSDPLFISLIRSLHGASMIHSDGMETGLSVLQKENAFLLRGAFHPQGKTYTITLLKN